MWIFMHLGNFYSPQKIQGSRSLCKASLWGILIKLSSGTLCKISGSGWWGVWKQTWESDFGCEVAKNLLGTPLPCSKLGLEKNSGSRHSAGEHVVGWRPFSSPTHFPFRKNHPFLPLAIYCGASYTIPASLATADGITKWFLFSGRKKEA